MLWLDEITYGRPPIRSQQIRRTDDHVTSMSQLSSWWRHQSIAVAITTWKVQNELSRLNLTGAIQWTWLVYEVTNQRLVLLANVKMYKKQIYYAKCLFSRKQPIYEFYFDASHFRKNVFVVNFRIFKEFYSRVWAEFREISKFSGKITKNFKIFHENSH